MSDLDRIKKLSGILNEDYQYDMTDKGDMHDALGDVQISMDDAVKNIQKASGLARQVSDEIEKTLYTDESVEEADDIETLRKLAGLQEDSVDMEKHNMLSDMYNTLEKLNSIYDELDSLDRDEDSSGVGDLTDQLTTMRKHIEGLYMVLDRSGRIVPMESVNEAVDAELMDEVIVQIKRDCDMGDYTAIEELLMSCPEDKLRGFLSEV